MICREEGKNRGVRAEPFDCSNIQGIIVGTEPFDGPAHIQEFVKVREQLRRRCASGERVDGE